MNLDELTIKQARELVAMFTANTPVAINTQQVVQNNIASPLIGKHVIARCYSAGVHSGEVVSVDGENVMLKNSRRLWSWKAKDGIALSGVAQNGIKDGKVDVLNPEIYLTGVCELIPTSEKAKESINGFK